MNGELVAWEDAKVHVLTHALHYGTGVFEGVRAYETPRGTADLPPRGAHRPAVRLGRHVLHGHPVLQGGDPGGHARDDRPQRPALLLHPPARLPRRRADGPLPARLPGRRGDRRVGVGRLPGRRGQAARRAREGLLVAAHPVRRGHPAGEGHRPVPQLRARQARGRQGRLRGGDPARRPRHGLRGLGREPLRDPRRRDRHARLRVGHPRRHLAHLGDPDRARPRLRGRRARHRPRRALPGRRGVHDRHGRRAHAAARDRRPARSATGSPARSRATCSASSRTRCTGARSATRTGSTSWRHAPRRRRERRPRLRLHPARRHAGGGHVAVRGGEAAGRARPRRPRRADDRGGLPGLQPQGGRALRAAGRRVVLHRRDRRLRDDAPARRAGRGGRGAAAAGRLLRAGLHARGQDLGPAPREGRAGRAATRTCA